MPRMSPWLLVPLAALVSVAARVWQARRVPAREDWRAATAAIQLAEADGVAWTPYWAQEGRLFLHPFGDRAFHLLDAETADLARYDRVWLLGAFGHDASDLPTGHTVEHTEQFGRVTLERVKVGGERVRADLRAELEGVRVSHVRGPRSDACDFWDGRGWHCGLRHTPDKTRACLAEPIPRRLSRFKGRRDPHCGLNPWIHVSRDTRVIGAGPRRCVWLHPKAGTTVRVEWPAVADGELVLDWGFADQVLTDRTGPSRTQPAQLKVSRGTTTVGALTLAPESGWHRWRAAAPGAEPVVLEVTTANHVDAHLCVDATIRGPR